MLYEFLINNNVDLVQRCRHKVSNRQNRSTSSAQLENGIPLFLDQLIRTLQLEQSETPSDSIRISGPASGIATLSEVGTTATQHGKDLFDMGFTVDEVVHNYGDLCQAITDLAVERDAPFHVDEFRTLNRCLDNAIAVAVSEFGYQQTLATASLVAAESTERAGFFAQELRNILGTASLAFCAAKAGNLSLSGATGSILERSLSSLSKMIDDSLVEFRSLAQGTADLSSFSLAEFVVELATSAQLAAHAKGCSLSVGTVDPTLALNVNRPLLLSAVANLLQNAIKFTGVGTEVTFNAYASAGKIQLDVADHCGGLLPNAEATMFLPFSQHSVDRNGMGLGLTIAKQSVTASGGTLSVRDLPTIGCVFSVSLPRGSMPK